MNNLKVIHVDEESITFGNGVKLFSNHDSDCCEHHWLSFKDISINDFDGLVFDLSTDDFFKRIPDYGIELIPTKGHSIKVPGYASNNGYYSDNLSLVLTDNKSFNKQYDITECQAEQ